MYSIPHYYIINTKIIVDNNVPEIFHLPPVNRRMFISKRFVDFNCFSNNNDGIPLSDMNQAFFHERKMTGLDSPAGNKIDFMFE